MRIKPKHSDSPIVIRKKMLPMLRPKMTPEISSCVSIIGRSRPGRRALPVTRRNVFLISGSSVPQMPFSPASMMNTSSEADHQLPIAEHLADHVLHAGIDDRTDDRPVQGADPAENRHHHRVGGARRAGDLRADEAEIDGVHRPGQRGGRVGDDKGEQPDAEVAVAEEFHLVIVELGRQAAGRRRSNRRDICRTPKGRRRPGRRR